MQTVTIGKKEWAVGLFWQPPEGPKGLVGAARARAKELNEEYEHNYNAFVTVLAEGDFLCSPDDAEKRIEYLSQLIDVGEGDPWDGVIEGETPDESQELLLDILARAGRVPRVRTVEHYVPVKKIILSSIVVTMVLVSYNFYASHVEKKRQQQFVERQNIAQQQAKELARKAALKRQASVKRPWNDTRMASTVIGSCQAPYRRIGMISNGWKMTTWKCQAESSQSMWVRSKDGSFIDLPYNATLNVNSPNIATSSTRVVISPVPRQKQVLLSQQMAARQLYETARRLKLSVSVHWETPEIKTKPSGEVVKQGFMVAQWQLSNINQYPSTSIGVLLDKISGLTLVNIGYKNGVWTIKGELYAKN